MHESERPQIMGKLGGRMGVDASRRVRQRGYRTE
jgi:hypothetical protein